MTTQNEPSPFEDSISDRRRPQQYPKEAEKKPEEDYLAPARWWFASTLFPLIAGTFGPMASAFNICALASSWRIIIDPNSSSTEAQGSSIPDPGWLYVVNAVSLGVAVLANFALVAQMADGIPFVVAQPVVIIGWYIAALLLVGLVAAMPADVQVPGQTLSQAFYYACIAAALYFILASMLCVTVVGVYIGRINKRFKLTLTQRSLMFRTIVFLGYILAAGAVYSRIEGWGYLDAVYWVDVTILTIGFGDFVPKTHLGRSLLFPMAVGGILFVGLIITSVSTLALDAGSKKVTARMVEKVRRKAIKEGNFRKSNGGLRPDQETAPGKPSMSELARREHDFNLMRQLQKNAASYNRMIALCISVGFTCLLWFIGALVFWQAEMGIGGEQWTYFESLYFTYSALLAIGYGDIYPQDGAAKPAFVFWSLIALPTLTVLIGAIGAEISETISQMTLWVGKHAPERGPFSRLKASYNRKIKGEAGAYQSAKPSGFMTGGNERAGDGDFDDKETADAANGIAQEVEEEAAGNHVLQTNTNSKEAKKAAERYRPYLLMKAMKNVVNHLDASPPRQYTYAEWAWFLKLLGEDESTPENHRSLEAVKRRQEAGIEESREQAVTRGNDGNVQYWSWLGPMSPLMASEDEPRWVLTRLMDTLERELKEAANEERSRG